MYPLSLPSPIPPILISVVIPARNAQSTLDQTLWSVRRQSHTHWEVIVVNDGSTDQTSEVIQAHRSEDPRIQEVAGDAQGVSAARNLGATRSRGALLAFLDADDLWLPEKLSWHVRALSNAPDIGVSFDRVRFVNTDASPTPVVSARRVGGLQTHEFLSENPACTASTLVVRREVFEATGGFDASLRHAEDLELMIRVRATTPWRVEGINRVLTHYRANPSGASSDLHKMQAGWESVMARVQTYAPELWSHHGCHATAIHMRYLARRTVRLGLPATEGLNWLKRAWQSSPIALCRQPWRSLGTLCALLYRLAKRQVLCRLLSSSRSFS
jgi:glycosyltransferase involved in cell wall biosynthesis